MGNMPKKMSYFSGINKDFQVSHNVRLLLSLLFCGVHVQDVMHFAEEVIL